VVTVLGSVISPLASSILPSGATTSAVFSTLIVAALFNPLRARIQAATSRLFLRGRLDRADALQVLLRDLPAAITPEEIGTELVQGVARLLGLRGASLLCVQPDERLALLARASLAHDDDAPAPLPFGVDAALIRRLTMAGRTESLGDLAEDHTVAPETIRSLEALGASALAPLRSRGHLVGVLVLEAPRSGEKHSYDDLRVLDAITPAAAIAVENAILVRQHAEKERLAAIGGVAAVIVHEIKNPLGIIRLSAGTLRKKFETGTSGEELGRCIIEEVDRMDRTLRQILSFARPQHPALKPCNLSQLVGQTIERVRPQLDGAKITVREDLDRTPPIAGDADQLERVFLNLFVNAKDAMGEAGGELRVRTRLVRNGRGDALEVLVEDTGPGMTDEVKKKLFQPFFSTKHGGTGLGLAIVKQIVAEHGGAIEVESAPEAGARFRITLPIDARA
jgi:signal transduction histidine kinase